MEEMDYEHEEMEEREGHALSTLFKAANVAAGALALARYFGPRIEYRNMLRWMGLARRRTILGTVALLGAGAVAGAGIAMFVSPMSGQQTRQGLRRGFQNIGRRGREMLRSAGSEIAQMTEGRQGEQSGREQGGREQGGREQGGREQGREGMRAGEQRPGEKQGEGMMGGARHTAGQPGETGNANRGEAGKAINR